MKNSNIVIGLIVAFIGIIDGLLFLSFMNMSGVSLAEMMMAVICAVITIPVMVASGLNLMERKDDN